MAVTSAARLAILGFTLLAGVLLVSELASILAIVTNTQSLYADARSVAGSFCHQLPSRCPWFGGTPTVLCFRCVGLYSGVLAGPWLWPRVREHRGRVAILSLIGFGPTLVELLIDRLVDPGISAFLRWATGVSLGFGCIALLSLLTERRVQKHEIGRVHA
jgi:uncharacterized membrane protein